MMGDHPGDGVQPYHWTVGDNPDDGGWPSLGWWVANLWMLGGPPGDVVLPSWGLLGTIIWKMVDHLLQGGDHIFYGG